MGGWITDLGPNDLDYCDVVVKLVAADARGGRIAKSSPGNVISEESKDDLADVLGSIWCIGGIDLLLKIERALLTVEIEYFANSSDMVSSLSTGIRELDGAVEMVGKVRDPDVYRHIDESCSYPKNRIGGLPRDQARQFFGSHKARLHNLNKGRSVDSEKKVIAARSKNIVLAEKIYKDMQREALCLQLEEDLGREPDF